MTPQQLECRGPSRFHAERSVYANRLRSLERNLEPLVRAPLVPASFDRWFQKLCGDLSRSAGRAAGGRRLPPSPVRSLFADSTPHRATRSVLRDPCSTANAFSGALYWSDSAAGPPCRLPRSAPW